MFVAAVCVLEASGAHVDIYNVNTCAVPFEPGGLHKTEDSSAYNAAHPCVQSEIRFLARGHVSVVASYFTV